MKTNRTQYFMREGMKNITRNKFMSVASIGTSFATLFILGIVLLVTLNVNHYVNELARGCQIQVFIDEDSTPEQYDQVGTEIKKIKKVESIEKYTKEQIFEEQKEKLGVDENGESILAGYEHDNPYRDSYKVTLKDPKQTANVCKEIANIEHVANVNGFQQTVDVINRYSGYVKTFCLWIVLVLGIISVFIVSNSIKTSVFSRRKEIHIMKYIGATNSFVRWPFLIEGVLIGLFGALAAFVVIWIVYVWVTAGFDQLMSFAEIAGSLLAVFIPVGILIGFVGSFFSVRKHLKV